MLAIHDGARPPAPKRPERVVPQRVAFTGTAEQPRTDYFIAGTGQTRIATASATARLPHITNPVSGSVYAIYPDILIYRQRLAIRVYREVTANRLTLDEHELRAADNHPMNLAAPVTYRLRLIELSVDDVT